MSLRKKIFLFVIGGIFLIGGIIVLWISGFKLPNIDTFEERKVINSTKIYDRTGEVLLYDVNEDIRRTMVPAGDISLHIKNATVAIEDREFYQHQGIKVRSIVRAILANLSSGERTQGGSTITQQVIKNVLLTRDKKYSRKLKEWFLALKLEKHVPKDAILALYLNEIPYGGNLYGIEEASKAYFGKSAHEIELAEAAYLAALPKAPSYYSPYGNHRDELEERKNFILSIMHDLSFITEGEYKEARDAEVMFVPPEDRNAKALHFVQYIIEYLEGKYGGDVVRSGGLTVTTTLDYELQQKAEEIVLKHALKNEEEWDASNEALVAIDPRMGHIIAMVGSRGYSDPDIDGNFNATLAKRQPGSAFKPFVYATAFKKGYTPDTILFNVRTQFTASCDMYDFRNELPCYAPENYNSEYTGPVNLREGIAQSINVASVKLLYLVGIQDSIRTARDMGIRTLENADRYGLTLVLGGGEVSLLDMTSAYGVFANDGVRNPPTGILYIENKEGELIEEFEPRPYRALDEEIARTINDVLSDNVARTPLFGSRSFLYFPDRMAAGKTGTTNNNRDAWLVGYTPQVVVGVWSGNNDNTPMKRGSAISGPPWREFMNIALANMPPERFPAPVYGDTSNLKPVFRGIWQGGESVVIDTISGKRATEFTPLETRKELIITNPHSILHWVDKDDPHGLIPKTPEDDSQYERWEEMMRVWLSSRPYLIGPVIASGDVPHEDEYDDVHTEENQPSIVIVSPTSTTSDQDTLLRVSVDYEGNYPMDRLDVFLNGTLVESKHGAPFDVLFIPSNIENIAQDNNLRVVAYDTVFNRADATVGLRLY
jgi:1A family penicillin-binding protein